MLSYTFISCINFRIVFVISGHTEIPIFSDILFILSGDKGNDKLHKTNGYQN